MIIEPVWSAAWPVAPLGGKKWSTRTHLEWSYGEDAYEIRTLPPGTRRWSTSGGVVTKTYLCLLETSQREDEGRGELGAGSSQDTDLPSPSDLGWEGPHPGWRYQTIRSSAEWLYASERILGDRSPQLSLDLKGDMPRGTRTWSGLPSSGWQEGVVEFDPDMIRRLGNGSAIQLYRSIQYLRAMGRREVPVSELLARIGSLHTGKTAPSKIAPMLQASVTDLVSAGILRGHLEYDSTSSHPGSYARFTPGDSATMTAGEDAVFNAALRLGIREDVAREWVQNHPTRLAHHISAALLGFLRPDSNLPGMVLTYARENFAIPARPRRIDLGAERLLTRAGTDQGYLSWLTQERERRQHYAGWKGTARRAEEHLRRAFPPGSKWRPKEVPWITEGLRALITDNLLDLPPLLEWRRTRPMAIAR